MRRKIVPDQDDGLTMDETLQVLEEGDETLCIEAIGLGSGEEACLLTIPTEPKRCRHRRFRPMVTAGLQDRRLPARRPRSADRGLLGESGFVLEKDPGTLASSVFFRSGQRTVFQ